MEQQPVPATHLSWALVVTSSHCRTSILLADANAEAGLGPGALAHCLVLSATLVTLGSGSQSVGKLHAQDFSCGMDVPSSAAEFLPFVLARSVHGGSWISCCTASGLPGQRAKRLVVCDSAVLCTKLTLEGTGISSWICVQIYLFPGQAQNLIVRAGLVIARWHHNAWYQRFAAFPSQVSRVSSTQGSRTGTSWEDWRNISHRQALGGSLLNGWSGTEVTVVVSFVSWLLWAWRWHSRRAAVGESRCSC